jgi:selenocysteine-specific elongation factor
VTTHHFIIATAGHVDHGKSALVKALTGTDPDRLPEEKARQITIELGFAYLELPAPSTIGHEPSSFSVGIVDVPGHEDFVRNMIAGVGSIDLALLVVAADDGWMSQTEEHLEILTYLGVTRAVVALTKSDLGGAKRIKSEISDQLRGTAFAPSPIVLTSVRTGEGIENLKSVLATEFATMRPQRDIGKPRLFIDRAFTLRGIGTVVTGTLTGGQLLRGQSIVVQPKNFGARIRSIQSHGSELESAQPGMRTAINLPDVTVGDGPGQIKRGDVITPADFGTASRDLAVLIEKSARSDPKSPAARALKNGASVYLHHGTSRFPARINMFKDAVLKPGKQTLANLKLPSPVFAFLGDRFVLRDASEQQTVGGGVVLDPGNEQRNYRHHEQHKLLAARAVAADDVSKSAINWVDLCVRSEIDLRGFAPVQVVLRKSHFTAAEIADSLLRLQRHKEIVVHEGIAAVTETWQGLRDRTALLIDNAHRKNPERAGFNLNELRTALRDVPTNVLEALLSDLCATDFIQSGSVIARRSHQPALPAGLETTATGVRETLSKKPFDPPARRAIELDGCAQQVLRFLVDAGEVIEVGSDVVLLRDNFERMKSAVVDLISKHGAATVSDLRRALQTSRRIMVPFLEKLDRDGVTRRIGDKRTLAH